MQTCQNMRPLYLLESGGYEQFGSVEEKVK